MEQVWRDNSLILTISPVRGDVELIPAKRTYLLNFRGIAAPESISITRNDSTLNLEPIYHGEIETLELGPLQLEPCDELVVTLEGDLLATRDRDIEKLEKFLTHFPIDTWEKSAILKDWPRIAVGELPLQRYKHLKDAQIQVLESLFSRK